MKYKCDMIKDLMPLCLDESATKVSEQVVIEHIAECKNCEEYYRLLNREIIVESDVLEPEKKYSMLAKKIRKRNYIVRFVIFSFVFLCVMLSFNYAAGYRFQPQKAADISGRLNYKSKVLGSYAWNNWCFYIYDSYSCYDIVIVEKTWHGWKIVDTCLNWPKWYEENMGIEMAGSLYFWSYDTGIQIFPFIVRDENVKTVEVTVFGETQRVEVNVNELILLTFENSDTAYINEAIATAYDENGNALYELGDLKGHWVWKEIE